MDDVSFESELQTTFLTEAEEMLEDTEAAFVAIEQAPDDVSKIDRIFRLVHTIKGSAYVAGFAQLGSFAHNFETLLGALRDKKLNINPAIIDVLLEGNDRLKDFVRALKQNRSATIDVSATEVRIKAALGGGNPAPPIRQTPPPKSHPQSSNAKAQNAEAALFLVVDDEPEILNLTCEALSAEGYRVLTATSAIQATQMFKTQSIDAIFTDLKMPDMNGIEFVSAVRDVNEFIPIAFVSGHSSRDHFKDYLRLGVDSFVEKPFNNDEILSVAKRLLREGQLRKSMLALSKLSFQTYVIVEKILATLPLEEAHAEVKQQLDRCMEMMRQETAKLLASERESKRATMDRGGTQ